jgi:hypothetical protein
MTEITYSVFDSECNIPLLPMYQQRCIGDSGDEAVTHDSDIHYSITHYSITSMKLRNFVLKSALAAVLPLVISACSSSTKVDIVPPPPVLGTAWTGDTIYGTMKATATLAEGKTYYMPADVIVPKGDTLLIQDGVNIVVIGASTAQTGTPEFQVNGSLIANGTAANPIFMSPPASLRQYKNLCTGLWGGIAGSLTSGDIILKYTHIEFAGGTASQTDPIYGAGGTRYAVWFENPMANFIMEDSWITGAVDDPVRVTSGRFSIFRNVFECNSLTSGDGPNIKSGGVGDMAYNLVIGTCTNGPKLANKGGINPQTGANMYNNTYITCGWRCNLTARAGSTDIEQGAYGTEYNNLIVNCRTGFRLVFNPLADTSDTYYDYQWYYGSTDSVVLHFCNDALDGGVQWRKPHDNLGKAWTTGANDPMFVGYSVTQVPAARFTFADAFTSQMPVENVMFCNPTRFSDRTENFASDFHLASGSPCIGTAYTGAIKTTQVGTVYPTVGTTIAVPMNTVTSVKSATNLYGADYTTLGLGADFGAYQSNGSGNNATSFTHP